MPRTPDVLRLSISITFTVAVIGIASAYLDWSVAIGALRNADGNLLGLALVLFATNWGLRTIRFHTLLGTPANQYHSLLGVTMLHGMFSYILPAKSGEFSYLLLAKKHLNVTLPVSAATLIVARLFDFSVIAILLPTSMLLLAADYPTWLDTGALIYCVTILTAVGALFVIVHYEYSWQPSGNKHWWYRPAQALMSTLDALRDIHNAQQYLRLWSLSFAIWICILMQFFCITASLGFQPEFAQMVVISVILIPLSLIPVQGVANVGTHEAAWITGLSLFGYDFDSSLVIAITSHVAIFSMFLILGLVGYAILRR